MPRYPRDLENPVTLILSENTQNEHKQFLYENTSMFALEGDNYECLIITVIIF